MQEYLILSSSPHHFFLAQLEPFGSKTKEWGDQETLKCPSKVSCLLNIFYYCPGRIVLQ